MTQIRFVDVVVTEPLFAGSSDDFTQLAPEVEVDDGERILGITGRIQYGGVNDSEMTVIARVWIAW